MYPVDSNYVTLAMQDLAPLVTADGALLPATGPGNWDQLALAGGGRHG
jgi:predicted nucleic acid-binding protein